MANTVNIRTTTIASLMATNRMELINKARKKAKKPKLSKSQIIALAIENLTIAQGVEK